MSVPAMFLLLVVLVTAFVAYQNLRPAARRERRGLRVEMPERRDPEEGPDSPDRHPPDTPDS
jgi:hypothetical protein